MQLANADQFRLLVVEDDRSLRRMVRQKLESVGFLVTTAVSGEEALESIDKFGLPHLALVDIDLPYGMSGLDFCQAVHAFSEMPIIMMTANNEALTIVQTIDQFAEDYITKPFNLNELVTRVGRVLRRVSNFDASFSTLTRIDDQLTIDFPNRQVIVGSERLDLTSIEAQLLYVLVRNAGRTVTTDFLFHRLWPLEEVDKHKLQVSIHRLRQKLGKVLDVSTYIVSERSVGYRFLKSS